MNNYLNFNTHKQVAFEYRNASKGFIGDTSKMLAPAGKLMNFVTVSLVQLLILLIQK